MDRKDAEEFVKEFLYNSPKRKTGCDGQPGAYRSDAVEMVIEAWDKGFIEGETKQAILECRAREKFIEQLRKEGKIQ